MTDVFINDFTFKSLFIYNQMSVISEFALELLFPDVCHQQICFKTLKRQSRLQQTTFINIFSLFFRENKT